MRYITVTQAERKALMSISSILMVFVVLVVNPVGAEELLTEDSYGSDAESVFSGEFETEAMACETHVSEHYIGGFKPQQFEWVNMEVDKSGYLSMNPARLASSPDKVVIPTEQEVYATFISETTGYASDLGWMLYDDAIDENSHYRGWDTIDESSKHIIFRQLVDDELTGGCCSSGNGILDSGYGRGDFPTNSETALSAYDDGSGVKFLINRDGNVTPRDMKKHLGRFAAGSEIVFFLSSGNLSETWEDPLIYFNKPWSQDVYGACRPGDGSSLWIDRASGIFHKLFHMDQPAVDDTCRPESSWLAGPVLNRLTDGFDLQLNGDYHLPVTFGERFSHMIGGITERNADKCVYGFENTEKNAAEADMDFSDVVFLIDRPNSGMAGLKPAQAIRPVDSDAFFTVVDFEVCDYRPSGKCTPQTSTTYFISTDVGASWVAVNRWDSGRLFSLHSDGTIRYGQEIDPAVMEAQDNSYTCRKRRIDLIEADHTGQSLIWKVEMMSTSPDCVPKVHEVRINAAASSNRILPVAAPVVQANLIYTGWAETPAIEWKDHSIRGHLKAREIYRPFEPDRTLREEHILWDAGEVMAGKDPDERSIFFPDIETRQVVNEHLVDHSGEEIYGDGMQTYFQGSLSHYPILATSVHIFDGRPENFKERQSSVLEGSFGGAGRIDRATGKWELRFSRPPVAGVPILADYIWYIYRGSKILFEPGAVTNEMLALSDEYVWPVGYTHDLNRDGSFDKSNQQTDAEWLIQWARGYHRSGEGIKKSWQVGRIGASGPALMVPPGYPRWILGTAVTENERQGYSDFRDTHNERATVLFAGSGDGLLHALDAGQYRYGDNPETTTVRENRGYFAWEPKTADSLPYCAEFTGSKCPNYGTGNELWAFIPAGVLPHLKNNALRDGSRFSVELSPVFSDVFLDTDGDGQGDSWRTVLICIAGSPVRSIFCLDVTDPHDPLFLWERTIQDIDREGVSPAVARIGRIRHPRSGEAIWVAFIATGRMIENQRYPSVSLLDVTNGNIMQSASLDGPADLNGDGHLNDSETNYGKGGILSGQLAIVDSDGNGFIDRAYLASSKGLIYKINIPDDDHDVDKGFTSCVINTDFTDSRGHSIPLDLRWQPIFASPTVDVETGTNELGEASSMVRVSVGTSAGSHQIRDISKVMNRNIFLSILDAAPKGACDQNEHHLDWFVDLEEDHRIVTSAFVAADRMYFGTTTSDTLNSCAASGYPKIEKGHLYVFDLEGREILSGRIGDVRFNPMVTDEHLYLMMPSGLRSLGSGVYNNRLKSLSEAVVTVRAWEEVK